MYVSYILAGELKTPIQTLSPCFSFTTAILLHELNVFDILSSQWFHDLDLPLTTSEVWASFPRWVKVVQSKTYIPETGAVNIPFEGLYPFPSFKSTVPKMTRPYVARLLTWFFSRTSKATTVFSKIKKDRLSKFSNISKWESFCIRLQCNMKSYKRSMNLYYRLK